MLVETRVRVCVCQKQHWGENCGREGQMTKEKTEEEDDSGGEEGQNDRI